jgi:hypothetical protein
MLTAHDVEMAFEEALGKATNARELGAFTVAALGRRLVAAHEDIEMRLSVLEERKALVFAGAYDITRAYSPGDLTQRSGSLWLALVETTEAPGQSAHWREIAKCR